MFDNAYNFLFGAPVLKPEEKVKKWQTELRNQQRQIDRQINGFFQHLFKLIIAIKREETRSLAEVRVLVKKVVSYKVNYKLIE